MTQGTCVGMRVERINYHGFRKKLEKDHILAYAE